MYEGESQNKTQIEVKRCNGRNNSLCVSLGSSTVQLHDSLVSRLSFECSETGFSSQKGDSAWGVYYRRAAFGCAIFWVGGMIFIKKYFLFTLGSVCRVKRYITGWQTFRWWRRIWNGGAEVAETTVRTLLFCGFRRTDKAMGQVYQCLWMICLEINVFFTVSSIKCFTFYVLLWPIYWLSLVRKHPTIHSTQINYCHRHSTLWSCMNHL
jgi:hypothetical protein